MWNDFTKSELDQIPTLWQTEGIPLEDKLIYAHLFINGCDWYIVEYDKENELFFCFAILNSDFINAEWGYVDYEELKEIKTAAGIEVDRELFWHIRPVKEIELITRCRLWK